MDGRSTGLKSGSVQVVVPQHKKAFIEQESGPPVSQRLTIGSLPDNVLLDVFDFCQVINKYEDRNPWNWETLVHVCQRWRYVVLESPIRLNLQLDCTQKTPVRKLLRVWPASLPITILYLYSKYTWLKRDPNPVVGFDNVMAALKQCDRVHKIAIANTEVSQWRILAAAMDEPFLALRFLAFESLGGVVPLPDTFLNGSAPCLQRFDLSSFSFPSFPRLLRSISDLTFLRLYNIPNSGYVPPETMATCLSALPKLEYLCIHFQSPTPHPQRRDRPVPPSTQFVFSALTVLRFQGVGEYFEVLAARIDVPLLDNFKIYFYHQPELFVDIPQTIRFFGHLKWPRPLSVTFKFNPNHDASIRFSSNTMPHARYPRSWNIIGGWLDWLVSSIAQTCSQILHFRSSVESLNIQCPANLDPSLHILQDEMDPTLWYQLFHSFTSVHNLEISAPLEPLIATALQGLTEESATEVFPSLHTLSIVGKTSDEAVQQGIQSFVAARQHSSHPVAILFRVD